MEQKPDTAKEPVLWDVVEEHLDEAQYACEELECQLDHATLSLTQVEQGIESRLEAHVDGLVVGGDVVARQLLAATFTADDLPEPGRAAAATFALIRGGHGKLAATALLHQDAGLRRAVLRGALLAGAAPLEAWALDRFRERAEPELRATLIPIVASRLEPGGLLACMQSDHAGLVAAAARAVACGPPGIFTPCMEELLEHDNDEVRRVAMLAGLAWGSARAWTACSKQAFGGEPRDRASLALFAALCSPKQHPRVAELLGRDELRAAALFALGFSGNPAMIPVLLEHATSADSSNAKLAAQAIALITGLDTQDDAYTQPVSERAEPGVLAAPEQDPEARAALPALEEDDLDADLVPIPEDALPAPNAGAIAQYWQRAGSEFSPAQRYVCGKPASVSVMLDALEHSRMRVRHVLAQALGIRTGGQCWLDTRGLASTQRARIGELRALQACSFSRQFGYA